MGDMACGTTAYTMTLGMVALGGIALGRTARARWPRVGLLGLMVSSGTASTMMGLSVACGRVSVVRPNEEAGGEGDNVLDKVEDDKIDLFF